MINTNTNALGIIFPNVYDELVSELTNERLMASIPFASRYRMIDFVLSSMVNCGIDNITVLVRENYFSLLDHLGSGREWDLSRKNGGLKYLPAVCSEKYRHLQRQSWHDRQCSWIFKIIRKKSMSLCRTPILRLILI